jgi:general secretion pathway protein D
MIFMRIVSSVLIVFLAISCAPKAVKEETKEVVLPAPVEDIKLPELPPKPVETPKETKEVKKTEPISVEKEAEDKYVILNFDGADIETVISTIGDLLNLNYILGTGITGKVTIQSYRKFPVKDLFPIFQTILEVNGLTAVKDGAFYKIVPLDTARQQPIPIQIGKEIKIQLDSSFVTQIVPLEYVRANDILNLLRNLMPRGTDLVVYEPANLLIVTAPPAGLIKFMKILEALDVSAVDRESIRTFVYYVENGEAKKLAEILKSLYGEKKEKVVTPRTAPVVPTPIPPPRAVTTVTAESLPGEVEGEVTIVAYEDINGLLIKTSTRSYLAILETLKKLDVPVKQVLIEVLIAEISLTDSSKFGIEWLLKAPVHIEGKRITSYSGYDSGSADFGGTIDSSITTITSPAGSYFTSIIKPERYGAILTAFASLGRVNVLASPHILAMDNKEANIQIGEEVPVATGLTQQSSTSESSTLVTSGQIQYKTVGTILTVKPRITEKDRVTLDITQEVSQLGENVVIAGQDFTGFSTKKAKTTASVQSGHTLIIGGLISETKNESKSGLPVLSKIPVLGNLFSTTTDTFKKTELLVMVTPHVIKNQEDADTITMEFKNKVKTIKEKIEKAAKELSEETSTDKDTIVVSVKDDASLMDIIEANGYTLKDEDLNAFLADFIVLNENIKSIKKIQEGSIVKLPLKHLKKTKKG